MDVFYPMFCNACFLPHLTISSNSGNIAWGNDLFNVDLIHLCSLLSSTERKNPQNFKGSASGKGIYNWAISCQIKKGICFDINQLIRTTLHRLPSYLFNVRLRHAHFVFYTFRLDSSKESEENPPSRINIQLIH